LSADGIGPDTPNLVAKLKDPGWRLRNLYWIINKRAQVERFAPWPEQERFLTNLWWRNIILKARQRGFSTLIQLMGLDTILFNDNYTGGVIAHDLDSAGRIFRNKIKFAYNHLPQVVRDMRPLVKATESELVFDNGSSFSVSTSVRSGTLQFLHVSEFGKIAARYPDKAREIVTGSLPAVELHGIIAIESTAEGQEGAFYDMTMNSMALHQQGGHLTPLDYRFHFATWYDAPDYILGPDDAAKVIIIPVDHAYFDRLEANLGVRISFPRRAWYVRTRDSTFGGDRQKMFQEYPSTPEEAFEQAIEGVFLADQLAAARRQGRVTYVPYNPAYPVNTWWDIGDRHSIWFHQRIGIRDHWINFMEFEGEPYSYTWRKMQETGYVWGFHYLPHDAGARRPGAEALMTDVDMLTQLGLRNIETVPRIPEVQSGIQLLREDFHGYWFDETHCAPGLKHASLYRKTYNERLGAWSDQPQKNGHDHAVDALRQKAQWYLDPGARGGRRRQRPSGMAA
jgi:hypothetical protein